MKNIEIDKTGAHAIIKLNPKVYSLGVVRSVGYVFLDRAYVILDETPDRKIEVFLKPKEGEDSPRKLAMDFYNELLNHSHYSAMVRDNYEIIKMVIQRALFSADPSMVKDMEDSEIESLLRELEEEGDEDIKEVIREIRDDDKKNGRRNKPDAEQ